MYILLSTKQVLPTVVEELSAFPLRHGFSSFGAASKAIVDVVGLFREMIRMLVTPIADDHIVVFLPVFCCAVGGLLFGWRPDIFSCLGRRGAVKGLCVFEGGDRGQECLVRICVSCWRVTTTAMTEIDENSRPFFFWHYCCCPCTILTTTGEATSA